jgi:hypothetical protein
MQEISDFKCRYIAKEQIWQEAENFRAKFWSENILPVDIETIVEKRLKLNCSICPKQHCSAPTSAPATPYWRPMTRLRGGATRGGVSLAASTHLLKRYISPTQHPLAGQLSLPGRLQSGGFQCVKDNDLMICPPPHQRGEGLEKRLERSMRLGSSLRFHH